MVGGMPTCTCPAGYNLESDMSNCYGWKVSSVSECSVTCGNGVKTTTRVCDKATGSDAVCEGEEKTTATCSAEAACPRKSI